MCLLIESLKLKDGKISNLEYHQSRLDSALKELFPKANRLILKEIIAVPDNCRIGLFKVRVVYHSLLEKVEIEPYILRSIQSLKVVRHPNIDYHLKYSDRQTLQELFAQKGNCDDIIIVKSGLVSDSFAANLLFFDGEQWFTPTTPLLKGTQRQFLLDRGIISKKEIREEDIRSYQKVGLINAMMTFEDMPVIPIERIF